MKCKILKPFKDKETGVRYTAGKTVDFKKSRIDEIMEVSEDLIEPPKSYKKKTADTATEEAAATEEETTEETAE